MAAGVPGNGDLSRELRALLSSTPYRRMWERHVRYRGSADISQAAIARVVADHLLDAGEASGDTGTLDRQLKDRIGRALTGKGLSGETLGWIIDAFDVSAPEAADLWSRFSPVPTTAVASPYRNVSIHELHSLGADGLPESHRTVQVIEALRGPVRHYTYRFDTDTAQVDVLRGGQAGPVYDAGDGLSAVDIEFSRPLLAGETASLEYLTTFAYHHRPPPEFRRAAARRIDSLELRVQFHPDKLPAALFWGTWQSLEADVGREEPAALDREHSAHRFVSGLERSIVGFRWEW